MDEQSARSIYEQKINQYVQSLLPNGAGNITETKLRHVLENVAQTAFSVGQDYVLSSLLTVNDVAELFGVNVSRVRAIAKQKHELSIGYQIPNTNQWVLRPSEIESLRPGSVGRPRKGAN